MQMLQREITEYKKGKRWLARMMGADPETFTQEDVNTSIEYLLPSHIFAKDARPKMDHPENMYVELLNAASKVDEEGRPFEAAFYTAQPNYYNVTFEVWEAIEKLDTAEPAKTMEVSSHCGSPLQLVSASEAYPSTESEKWFCDICEGTFVKEGQNSYHCTSCGTFDVCENCHQKHNPVVKVNDDTDIFWMTKPQLEKYINEHITDKQYSDVLNRWKRLASHPRASLVQDVLSKFSIPQQRSGSTASVLERVELVAGEARAEGRRKTATAEVFVREGSGQVRVNGKHLNEFFRVDGAQQQVAYPLLVTGDLFSFDVDGYVMGGGYSGQAGALRLAISRAIVGLHPEKQPLLDAAGLLRQDTRRKERKKPGKARARKKYAWKRR